MTHRMHGAPGEKKKQQQQGQPFDPEELSRKLTAHLVEQRRKAEKQREAKVAKQEDDETVEIYHHTPTVTMSAFEQTTSHASRRRFDKQSEPALRVPERTCDGELRGPSSVLKMKALDEACVERDVRINRNRFRCDADFEHLQHNDGTERHPYEPAQRSSHEDPAYGSARSCKMATRPLSMGAPYWKKSDGSRHSYDLATHDKIDRMQRDEDAARKKKDKGRASPLLKKMESSWSLMIKWTPRNVPADEFTKPITPLSPPTLPKPNMRGGFLARFRHHPT